MFDIPTLRREWLSNPRRDILAGIVVAQPEARFLAGIPPARELLIEGGIGGHDAVPRLCAPVPAIRGARVALSVSEAAEIP